MERVVLLGKVFGYPDCCVDAFVVRHAMHEAGEEIDPGPFKLDGTGFVPCPACNQKSEAELISIIQARRKYHEAFPDDPF